MIQLKKTNASFLNLGFISIIALCHFSIAPLSFAEVPRALEPLYAEATLAYNASDPNRALLLVNELQKQIPTSTEVLELKGLILKSSKPKESVEVYKELIR